MTSDLRQKHCASCEGIGQALSREQIDNLLPQLDRKWEVRDDHKEIKRSFSFANFYETMAFVNAIAWIANGENHHPDLEIGYNYCHIRFMTHALKGLTLNDFICAAKVDALLDE
ncbi:4a-hydroxytetrahydrobiopterin dehydratase [Legionella spiritensis]|uniref:Putative pterin-4-alpha-carbinolamine dehydratase n=1 Tax=Legionella spiritensis TaxID=452 RepID=A0A0W0Z9W7_LEGSP|nr:4a-hydroxytetrahydrobiopterin dehydratase [Legionella spiritensis]KTD65710.1 pterin 4 alpha carbinolamine dehydratase [Legionella spiritensis]SNV43352.1 Pterin-4a-carbinolamine dehydratase [Legionella spiritensis]